jgi:dipeptidase
VAQSRKWMPRQLAGVLWFGVDDAGTTVRFPIYGSATRVPKGFAGKGAQDGVVPPMMEFSIDSAFYVFNLVANWAYQRWDLIWPEVSQAINSKETQYIGEIAEIDKKMVTMLQSVGSREDEKQAKMNEVIEYTTSYSVETGNALVADWFKFFGKLFVKYRDGYVVSPNAAAENCGCSAVSASYPQSWFDRIVKDTGSHYLHGTSSDVLQQGYKAKSKLFETKKKTDLRALQ